MLRRDWKSAIDLLNVLDHELQLNANNTTNKLFKLIAWEKLLIQINQLLEEWPSPELGNAYRKFIITNVVYVNAILFYIKKILHS